MSIKKMLVLALVVALMLSVTTGCGSNSKATTENSGNESAKKVLTIAQDDIKVPLDAQLTTDSYVGQINRLVVEPLLVYDGEMNLLPNLIKDMPTVSEDGLTYSFELKEGIKFHNGDQLTSNDVKFTFERMFLPETKATSNFILEIVKGVDEMLDGSAKELSGFKVIDERKFEITLKEPYAPFVSCLGTGYTAIYPEKACKEAGDKWGLSTFIGTGPYKLNTYESSVQVILDRNDEYHGGKKNIDQLVFKFISDPNTALLEFEKGNVDIAELQSKMYSQYSKDQKFKDMINACEPYGVAHFMFNSNIGALKDPKVREAFSLAIDREKLCNTILEGCAVPAIGFLPSGINGHNSNNPVMEYNPEKAKQILKEAGYENGVDVEFMQYQSVRFTDVIVAIQAMLKEVGINMEIKQVDQAVYNEARANATLQISLGHWFADFPDADNFLYTMFFSENSRGRYNNPVVDEMCMKARRATDEAERTKIYEELDNIVARKDYVDIPLYYDKIFFLIQPDIKGVILGKDSLVNVDNADIVR